MRRLAASRGQKEDFEVGTQIHFSRKYLILLGAPPSPVCMQRLHTEEQGSWLLRHSISALKGRLKGYHPGFSCWAD